MEQRECLACGKLFLPRSQNPSQTYCSKKSCQRERRRRWQQLKRETDEDYVDNQARAQQAWSARNPDYWRTYRNQNPQYVDDNRAKQLVRNYQNRVNLIAKMDASKSRQTISSGLYRLILLPSQLIAKKNAWNVFLSLLPDAKRPQIPLIAKRGRVAK